MKLLRKVVNVLQTEPVANAPFEKEFVVVEGIPDKHIRVFLYFVPPSELTDFVIRDAFVDGERGDPLHFSVMGSVSAPAYIFETKKGNSLVLRKRGSGFGDAVDIITYHFIAEVSYFESSEDD